MAELSGQQVLVRGGAGFVGRSAVRALRLAGARARVVDRDPFPDGDVTIVVGEITDPSTQDAVVGGVCDATIREDLPLRPLTPYGATKAACERDFVQVDDIAVIIDIGRARSLGYEPTVALEDGLATAWADVAGLRARTPVGRQVPRP